MLISLCIVVEKRN